MTTKTKIQARSLSALTDIIRKDWGSKMYFGAVPYFKAMETLYDVNQMYGYDSGKSIVN